MKKDNMEFNKKVICWLDLETTGVDITKDRIVEIAVIKVQDGKPNIEKGLFINPEMPIPAEASKIHKITDDIVKSSPTFKQIAKALIEFFDGCDFGGYNCNYYDIPLLYNEFQRAGIEWDLSKAKIVDVCTIFKRQEERTLEAAMKFYCNKEHKDAHSAMADVKATIEIFDAQQERYPTLPKVIAVLDKYCNYDVMRCDVSGNFTRNEAGEYVFNFGKNKGKLASSDKSYLEWMVNGSFNADTKKICKEVLNINTLF